MTFLKNVSVWCHIIRTGISKTSPSLLLNFISSNGISLILNRIHAFASLAALGTWNSFLWCRGMLVQLGLIMDLILHNFLIFLQRISTMKHPSMSNILGADGDMPGCVCICVQIAEMIWNSVNGWAFGRHISKLLLSLGRRFS